jgi:glycyl-tRNA synthetase (class II)
MTLRGEKPLTDREIEDALARAAAIAVEQRADDRVLISDAEGYLVEVARQALTALQVTRAALRVAMERYHAETCYAEHTWDKCPYEKQQFTEPRALLEGGE